MFVDIDVVRRSQNDNDDDDDDALGRKGPPTVCPQREGRTYILSMPVLLQTSKEQQHASSTLTRHGRRSGLRDQLAHVEPGQPGRPDRCVSLKGGELDWNKRPGLVDSNIKFRANREARSIYKYNYRAKQ